MLNSNRKVMNKLVIIAIVLLLFGCSKDLEKVPLDAPSTDTFLKTEAELQAAIVGCLSPLNLRFGENPYIIAFDMYSDIAANRDNTPHAMWGTPTAGHVNTIWNTMYTVIARCNFVLDNIDRVESTNEVVINQAVGVARFLRAYSYAVLSQFYGDVPLVTTTLDLANAYVSRDPKKEVVDFILAELDAAAAMLPVENSPNTMVIPQGAAWALASRVALYNERWAQAIAAAEQVMAQEGTQYVLNPDYSSITHRAGKTSKEIIWAIQFNYTDVYHETPVSFRSRMASGYCNRIPVQALIDSYDCTDGLSINQSPSYDAKHPYEHRDPRLAMSIALPGSVYYGYQFETHKDSTKCWNYNVTPAVRVDNLDATHTYASFSGYCWRKYADPTEQHATRSDINPIVIRYAEVLLNYAEAKLENGEVDDHLYEALNKIRRRVNMPEIKSGQSVAALRTIIRKERKVELAGEGLRYFDIIRWKIADQVLNGPCYRRIPRGLLASAPTFDENGTPNYSKVTNASEMRVIQTRLFNPAANDLWPIPDIELQTNKKLTQNPGY